MRNRIWLPCLAAALLLLSIQVFVAPTPKDREFVGNLTMLFAILTIVFSMLDSMGRKKK